MERFARAIGGLGKISQEVLDAVIVEFLELLTSGPEISGGSKAARKLLSAVLEDEDEVQRLIDGRRRSEVRSVWERLNDTPAPAVANFLQGEHPQTAAVVLSEMRAEVAASVLGAAGARLRPDHRPAPVAGADARPADRRLDPGRHRARLPLGPAAQPLQAPAGGSDRGPDEQHLHRGARGLPELPRGAGALARPGRPAHDVHLRRHRGPPARPRRRRRAARRRRGGAAQGAEARRGAVEPHRRLRAREPAAAARRALCRGAGGADRRQPQGGRSPPRSRSPRRSRPRPRPG